MTSESAHPLGATHPLALAPVTGPASSVDGFVRQFLRNLNYERGVALSASTSNDRYIAFATTVRDYLMARWLEDQKRQRDAQAKGVAYLSAEYLLGRQLDNNLLATGLSDIASEAMAACGIDI
ncbi:MAG: glycogen phosphorylase, partial [Microbacterium sp.]